MTLLADAAPQGTGLAIVGIILLVLVLAVLAAVILPIRWFLRRRRRAYTPADPGESPSFDGGHA